MGLQETLRSCVLRTCAGLKHVNNSTGAKLEASLAKVGSGQECAVLGVWLCPQASLAHALFHASLELQCGGAVCFVAEMVSLFRRVLPDLYETTLEDAGELRTGPLPPRPANKIATWPKLTSGNQKARCLLCPLIHRDVQRVERQPQRYHSVL